MATRTYFSSISSQPFFQEKDVHFVYVPGQSLSQQQKSIRNMHQAISEINPQLKILEISTKSSVPIGNKLSAFNLQISHEGALANLESVYQSTKVFESGGPFLDLAYKNSLEAKKDLRLRKSGILKGFQFEGYSWQLSQSPNFYDYLYSRGVLENNLLSEVASYDVFTDFAYSNIANKRVGNKSHNCQARSAAILVSLNKVYGDLAFEEVERIAFQNSENNVQALTLFD